MTEQLFTTKHGLIETISKGTENAQGVSVLFDNMKLIDVELDEEIGAVLIKTWIDFHDTDTDEPAATISIDAKETLSKNENVEIFNIEADWNEKEELAAVWIIINNKKTVRISHDSLKDSYVASVWEAHQNHKKDEPAATTVLQMENKVQTDMSVCEDFGSMTQLDCPIEECGSTNVSPTGTFMITGDSFYLDVTCGSCGNVSQTGDGQLLHDKAKFNGKELTPLENGFLSLGLPIN